MLLDMFRKFEFGVGILADHQIMWARFVCRHCAPLYMQKASRMQGWHVVVYFERTNPADGVQCASPGLGDEVVCTHVAMLTGLSFVPHHALFEGMVLWA